jgi:hypothetical protein
MIAMLFGFGVVGTVIAFEVGTDGLLRFLSFTGVALLLAPASSQSARSSPLSASHAPAPSEWRCPSGSSSCSFTTCW